MRYLLRFSPTALLGGGLIIFTIFNPVASLDLAAFLVIAYIVLHKIFGDNLVLLLLAIRPTLDRWRDYNIFVSDRFTINLNSGLSILLLLWAVYFFVKERGRFKKLPLLVPWLLFIAWNALTLAYSFDVYATLRETIKAANLFAFFGMAYILYQKNGALFEKRMLSALLISAIAPISLALFQLFTGTGMTIDDVQNRVYGTFAHPNILATFLLLLLIIGADIFINFYRNKRFNDQFPISNFQSMTNLLTFLPLTLLLFTYTRIAWIGAALFFGIVAWKYWRRALLYIAFGMAVFYAVFYPLNQMLVDNFNLNMQSISVVARLTVRSAEADSIAWRRDLANKVIPLWLDRPVLGYGYGAFPKVWDDNKGVANIWDNTSEAHNDYIKIGFESGLIGLALFLSIFAALLTRQIRYALKNQWKNIVFIASILVYLVLSLSDNMLHHTPVIWWMWAVWGLWSAKSA